MSKYGRFNGDEDFLVNGRPTGENVTSFWCLVRKNGSAENFIFFKAKKKYVWLFVKASEDKQLIEAIDDANIEAEYRGYE